MMEQPTFGELLRRSRQVAGLTQEALAARAGLSARTISDLERGMKHSPRPDTVQLLLAALPLSQQERTLLEMAARTAAGRSSAVVAPEGSRGGASPYLRASDPLDPAGSAHVSPLIGRAREQALLESHLRGEGPPLLVLAGEPGIGKTRLLREAVDRAATLGLQVVQSHGQWLREPTFCEPLLGALRRQIRERSPVDLRTDLEGCARLVRLLPELVDGPVGSLPPMSLPPEQEWQLIAEAVARFLRNVAGPAGTLLVLDDLHRADAQALTLVAALVRSTAPLPLRVLGAYRDTEIRRGEALHGLLADLAHARLVAHVTLSPLPSEEAARLLQVLVDDGEVVGAAWQDAVLHRAGGVPFHLVSWAEQLHGGEMSATAVPWAVRHSIDARVDAVPPAARPVLEALAVAGGRATSDLLMAVTALPEEQVLAALETACLARLAEQDTDVYRFAYEAVRATVESSLSAARRMSLRRRLEHHPGRGLYLVRKPGEVAGGEWPGAGVGGAGTDSARGPAVWEERAYHLAVLLRRHAASPRPNRRPVGG